VTFVELDAIREWGIAGVIVGLVGLGLSSRLHCDERETGF
jgi:hypothetical protein